MKREARVWVVEAMNSDGNWVICSDDFGECAYVSKKRATQTEKWWSQDRHKTRVMEYVRKDKR